MNDVQKNNLLFEPKAWTPATVKNYDIGEEELTQRQQLEDSLSKKQDGWLKKALGNLEANPTFYQELIGNEKLDRYLWNAVKEATLEALSGILHRHSPEETEEMIDWVLMNPDDARPFRFARMEEETESIYSFQNLMRGKALPDCSYTGKITNVDSQIIEDKTDRNYSRFILIFEMKITEGQHTGKTVNIPFILSPYYLYMRTDGEAKERIQERVVEYQRKTFKTFRNVGVVITDAPGAMTAQIAHVAGNIVRFTISRNGKKATIDELVERIKTFDEILKEYPYLEIDDIKACLEYASLIANTTLSPSSLMCVAYTPLYFAAIFD